MATTETMPSPCRSCGVTADVYVTTAIVVLGFDAAGESITDPARETVRKVCTFCGVQRANYQRAKKGSTR